MLFSKFIKQKKLLFMVFWLWGLLGTPLGSCGFEFGFEFWHYWSWLYHICWLAFVKVSWNLTKVIRSLINNLAKFSQVNYFFHVQTFCIFNKKKNWNHVAYYGPNIGPSQTRFDNHVLNSQIPRKQKGKLNSIFTCIISD